MMNDYKTSFQLTTPNSTDYHGRVSYTNERRFDLSKMTRDRPPPTPTPSFGNKKG